MTESDSFVNTAVSLSTTEELNMLDMGKSTEPQMLAKYELNWWASYIEWHEKLLIRSKLYKDVVI